MSDQQPPIDITDATMDSLQGTADPYLGRMAWSHAQRVAYAEAAEELCHCEGLCTCHWDDPGSPAMRRIERMAE